MSNESSDVLLNNTVLNDLFRDQLIQLCKLILQKQNHEQMELCYKWIKKFCESNNNQNIARNCLCTLMLKQLTEFGCLKTPFTDPNNIKLNLELILNNIDNCDSETICTSGYNFNYFHTFDSHRCNYIKFKSTSNSLQNESSLFKEHTIKLDCMEHASHRTNLQLENDCLRLQQNECSKLEKYCQEQEETFNKKFEDLNLQLMNALESSLCELETNGINKNFLQNIFLPLIKNNMADSEIIEKLKEYDNRLQDLLFTEKMKSKNQMVNLNKNESDKEKRKIIKLKAKYRRALSVNNWAHAVQLKLFQLKIFSSLREMFLKWQNNKGPENVSNMLFKLEKEYQKILNEMI